MSAHVKLEVLLELTDLGIFQGGGTHNVDQTLVVMEMVFCRKVGADGWCVFGPFADNPGFAVKANLRREELVYWENLREQ